MPRPPALQWPCSPIIGSEHGHVKARAWHATYLLQRRNGNASRTPEEIAADVIIVRPDQGEGYTGYGPAQVWIAHLDKTPGKFAAAKIERLTHDDVWYGDPQWSPDGRSLVVHANKTDDRELARYSINKNFDLWQIDVQTHQVRQLTSGPGPEVSPRFSPDGQRLVCLSIPGKGTHRDVFNLAVVTLGEGGARTEVVFDHHRPDAEKGPHPAPSFPLPTDCWDGSDYLVYHAAAGTETLTIRLHLKTGKGEPVASLEKGRKPEPSTLEDHARLRLMALEMKCVAIRQFEPTRSRRKRSENFPAED